MKVLSTCLVLLAAASAACEFRTPPRATSINPICLAFCSARADIGDDSVNSVQHTYSPTKSTTRPAKPKPASTTITSTPPPAVAIPGHAIPGAASAPIPASAPADLSQP